MTNLRIGHGYDVHKLIVGRPLILGGVTIPYEKGLDGHSDADVLTHALLDALLGAMGMGDIGRHFPDNDPAYKGISSLLLAGHVRGLMERAGYTLVNADITVIAQKPRLAPYIGEMEKKIAASLGCDSSCLNVKATTEEGLGFSGRGEGIAAHAVCLLEKT